MKLLTANVFKIYGLTCSTVHLSQCSLTGRMCGINLIIKGLLYKHQSVPIQIKLTNLNNNKIKFRYNLQSFWFSNHNQIIGTILQSNQQLIFVTPNSSLIDQCNRGSVKTTCNKKNNDNDWSNDPNQQKLIGVCTTGP